MSFVEMVWFDFGGVLSPPIPKLFEIYSDKTGIPPAALQAAMQRVADDFGVPILEPVESALLTEKEWGTMLRRALEAAHPDLDLSRAQLETFGKQWFSNVSANETMVESVRALKQAGKAVGILTNNVVEWEPHWRAMVGLDDVVDIIVDSSKERCRKPEERFFEIACQRVGVDASRSLLIDDVQENVAAAMRLGWSTILFTTNSEAIPALSHFTGVHLAFEQEKKMP